MIAELLVGGGWDILRLPVVGGEVVVLAVLLALTMVSWATRPPGRRLPDAPG